MPVLRSASRLDAGPRAVAGLLRDSEVVAELLAPGGHRIATSSRLLCPADEPRLTIALRPGARLALTARITHVSPDGMTAVLVRGPIRARYTTTLIPTGGGTWVRDELRWTARLGHAADAALLRRSARRVLAARAEVLARRAAALGEAPVVVATALVRDGAVLVAQRSGPPELAGRWELPGGRVEPGESEIDAVSRECREELGTAVRATGRLGTDLPIAAGTLRVHRAELVPGAVEPEALEHVALRWVGPAGLRGLDWVAADRAVVADLVAELTGP